MSLACWLLACSDAATTPGNDAAATDMDAAEPSMNADASDPELDASDPGTDAGEPPLMPHPLWVDLAAQTAIDLGVFECTAPDGEGDGQCRAATDYSGLVYDGRNHELLMFGGGHSTTMTDTIFAFDLEQTLSWTELYLPTPCELMVASNLDAETGAWKMGPSGPYPRPLSVHTYDLNAYSPEQNEFILVSRSFTGGYCNTVGNDVGGTIAHYALDEGTWSFSDAAPSQTIAASERDPMTGVIVVLGQDGLKLYDPVARAYTDEVEALRDPQGAPYAVDQLGYANHMVYFPPNDTFYYFKRGQPVEVVALKLDRMQPEQSTLETIATDGPSSPHDEPGYDYDSRNQIIGGGVADSTFYEFDPIEGMWSSHAIAGGEPGSQAFHAIGYDPASNVFVFRTDYDGGSRTWAFRLR